ncbi:MAG: molybdopterin-dependent oxidoreductase [Chloroflexota bacterium]|nr:molybdopterin-dependent oxidoreductase [Chloroflexota bacterium]
MMKTKVVRGNHRFWIGFAAGLVAGAIATGVMLWLAATFGGISLPEAVGTELTLLMPPSWFEYVHQVIGAEAKHYLFYGIVIGQCLVFALSGALYYQRVMTYRQRFHWYQGFLLALLLWLLTGVILLPATGAGIFGAQIQTGHGTGMLSLAVVGLIFGILFVLIQHWLTIHFPGNDVETDRRRELAFQAGARQITLNEESERKVSRRAIVQGGVVVIGLGIVGVGLWRIIIGGIDASRVSVAHVLQHYQSKIVPPPVPNYGQVPPTSSLSPEITPNSQYYIVSKNLFADPTVDANTWRLTVDGQVAHPYTLAYQEVLTQPMQQQYESMMCVSNEVGGLYMSNALWEGIPLKDLLQRAGIKTGATKVVLHAADNYSDSIHLTKALESTTLLAVYMNGGTLPQEHGFPARLLVPGIYGMKHCKWITRIEVVNYDYQGYWQQRGWSDASLVRLTARIDTPSNDATITASRPTYIAGVAFSGNKGISEVDVSTDSGKTWRRATLKHPLSNLTWVLWEMTWQPPRGKSVVTVRAIDLEGNVQSPIIEPPLPNGSSGYHSITVNSV